MAANTARKRKQDVPARRSSGNTRSRRASKGTRGNVSRNVRPVRDTYDEPVGDEIRLVIVLAISALLLLSVLGFAGKIGSRVSVFMFGFFGIMAFTVPFVLFIGTTFLLSNRGSFVAKVKMAGLAGLIWAICSLIDILGQEVQQVSSFRDGFRLCASSRSGGGLFGYLLVLPLWRSFGKAGTMLIFICLLVIFAILLTGRRLFVRIGAILSSSGRRVGERMDEYRIRRQEYRASQMEEEEYDEEEEDYVSSEIDDDLEEDYEEEPPRSRSYAKRKMSRTQRIRKKEAGRRQKAEMAEEGIEDKEASPALKEGPSRPSPSITLKAYRTSSDTRSGAGSGTVRPGGSGRADTGSSGSWAEQEIRVPEFLKGGKMQESSYFAKSRMTEQDDEKRLDQESVTAEKPGTETVIPSAPDPEMKSAAEDGADTAEGPVSPKKAAVHTKRPKSKEEAEVMDSAAVSYQFPPYSLLIPGDGPSRTRAETLRQTAVKLQETFDSFGVGVTVTNVSVGPTVTRYELQPDTGVKVSRIVSLSDDIKLNLAVEDIRIEAPIPGKPVVGIEVPNEKKEMVRLRDLLESDAARKMKSKIAFAAGKDIGGQTIMANIEKMPHLLIAGATGSGKSVCINTIIMSVLYRARPDEVKLIMVDPKVVELTVYNGLPHLLIPVVTDPKKAAGALNWAVQAMMDRYNLFQEVGTKNIKGYNEKISRIKSQGLEGDKYKKLPQILIIIDELADLMQVARSEVEDAICRLAQLARAAGIHLVIATQRPSVDVITGLIKANVPSRIAFAVSSSVDSRTILDMGGAEKLLGDGDMLFHPQGSRPVRVQGAFVSEEEITEVVEFIAKQSEGEASDNEEILRNIDEASAAISSFSSAASTENDRDLYFEDAGKLIIEKEKASIGMLQRVFKIGFNRAARIMDQLAAAGVVGPEIGTKPREVRMTLDEFEHYLATH